MIPVPVRPHPAVRSALALAAPVLLAAPAGAASFLCFGDSITSGDAGRATDSYLGPLADYMASIGQPGVFINAGLGGETTASGEDRLASRLPTSTVDMVLVMEGTNDVTAWVRGGMDENETDGNLRDMVDAIRAAGKRAILATVVPRIGDGDDPSNSRTRRLNDIIRDVARDKGADLADVYEAVEPFQSRVLYKDSLHPNGYLEPVMAEAFAAAVTAAPRGSIDLAGPLPTEVHPGPGSTGVSRTTAIEVELTESHFSVDIASIRLDVDGSAVTPLVSDLGGGRVLIEYSFPDPLRFGQSVRVDVHASDTGVPAQSTDYSFTFRTISGNGTNGDVDGSGRIDGKDVAILSISFGSREGESRYRARADIDGNGVIDGRDLAVVSQGFGGAP